ncbi:hypothetical protein HPB51_019994 [Rhipicephalus microplus]|uniref:Uncharacterized protein n=1 Tax=Rhipicephalus microplus TaxID=6941 RepID=A0A9J6E313_RHIMP|nr:hypothetical protein HPB51_019994 [Rhipicephalus microplus]
MAHPSTKMAAQPAASSVARRHLPPQLSRGEGGHLVVTSAVAAEHGQRRPRGNCQLPLPNPAVRRAPRPSISAMQQPRWWTTIRVIYHCGGLGNVRRCQAPCELCNSVACDCTGWMRHPCPGRAVHPKRNKKDTALSGANSPSFLTTNLGGSEWDTLKAGVAEHFWELGVGRAREERAGIKVVFDAILLLSKPLSGGPGTTAAPTSLRKEYRVLLQRRWYRLRATARAEQWEMEAWCFRNMFFVARKSSAIHQNSASSVLAVILKSAGRRWLQAWRSNTQLPGEQTLCKSNAKLHNSSPALSMFGAVIVL